MEIVRGFVGVLIILGVAVAFSRNRKAIDWRLVGSGILLQIVIGVLITQVPFVKSGFESVSEGFVTFLGFTEAGAGFLFGPLADVDSSGFIFVFQVLTTIVFFSAVSTGLYYLGILQKIVWVLAWVMKKTMRLSGAESLSVAGNIFLGQTEAPLLVKPFIAGMTKSELMCLMTGGMATIAGGVLAGYVKFLGGSDPVEQARFASYLLSASVMNAPAAVVMAKILFPEEHHDQIDTEMKVNPESVGVNIIDAVSRGTSDGLGLAMNVGAMLLSFIAIIAAINYMFTDLLGEWIGYTSDEDVWISLNMMIKESTSGAFEGLSLEYLFGQVFRVFAYIMGVEWSESLLVGSLLGQKTAINEFVAYSNLSELKAAGDLSSRAIIISTYALCGFSNFSSIAIQVGGIGALAPSQQANLSKLGLLALLAASLACLMTGTMAGIIL
ncbi:MULTISPECIES: NupC/NupG family nucleoside CNT transporter [Persicobacter]|uniref:Nucleoside transporter NupC n=1 Tax=Persicobacter diffluens TaxID=981 RepID=A0AAN5AIT4_9BACT|nr:nucleoside transporter C-terminal domain-containing protein [Persicobacter sp. CCB-QB2]GJM60835.1 nucleoside transporter NupC [Persicobacter diffluens]